jgi:hypothetical protein
MRMGDGGLCREHRGVPDALAMMQQLGAVPKARPPPAAYPDPAVSRDGERTRTARA